MTEKYSKSIYFIGPGVGTDAGGWYIGPDGKVHRVPGWNPEVAVDLAHAISVLREAGQIKQKGLAEAVIRDVLPQVQAQLGEQLKDGGVLVIGG